jgi:F-type H+-transporting ATPase subunit delta
MSRVAGRYAKSLMDLAIEKNTLAAVVADIQGLAAAVKNRDLELMLKSPIINADKKEGIMKAIFGGKMSDMTMAFINICITKGREGLLPEIAAEFLETYKVMQGLTSVKVTTAAPLSTAALAELKAKLVASSATSKDVEIQTVVNPDIIGGYIVEFGDKLYDTSVAGKLAAMKKEFTGNLYESKIEKHGSI